MEIKLPETKSIILRPVHQVSTDKLVVTRIMDDPVNKTVLVWADPLPSAVELTDLSGENYDNPPWTNELIAESLIKLIKNMSF